MKKAAILFIIGVSALLFSCRKVQENPRYTPTQDESTLVKTGAVTLELSMQNASTKASLTNSGEARWQLDDSVAVYCTDGTRLCFRLDSKVAESRKAFFKGVVPDGKELGSLILYPYTAATDLDIVNDRITLNLPGDKTSECGVMYGKIEYSNKIELQQLMGYAVFSIKNINTQTRRLTITSDVMLSGSMDIKLSELLKNGVPAKTVVGNPGISLTFDNAPESSQQICIPVPVGTVQQYNVATYTKDGKFMVSTDILQSAVSTSMAGITNYTDSLPEYKGEQRPVKEGYACVCGIYWALGNLTYNSTKADENGFQSGWHLAENQWMYRYYDQGVAFNKNSFDYDGTTQRTDVATDKTYYDHFTFGGIEENFSYTADGGFIKGNSAVSIAGKMFTDNECTVSADFASAKFGDIAYWATNGRLRLPAKAELELLTTGADAQFGHVVIRDVSGNPVQVLGHDLYVWGMYFTDKVGDAPVVSVTDVEITEEMLSNGRGLFLPLAGRKANSSDAQVISTRMQALYWSGLGSDKDCSEKYKYGYAWALNITTSSVSLKEYHGDAYTRNSGWCIRPILVE